jgi:hypothetical protein
LLLVEHRLHQLLLELQQVLEQMVQCKPQEEHQDLHRVEQDFFKAVVEEQEPLQHQQQVDLVLYLLQFNVVVCIQHCTNTAQVEMAEDGLQRVQDLAVQEQYQHHLADHIQDIQLEDLERLTLAVVAESQHQQILETAALAA